MLPLRVHSTLLNEYNRKIKEKSSGKFWIEVENGGFGKWKLMSKSSGWHSIERITEQYYFDPTKSRRVKEVAIDTTTDAVLISYTDYLNEDRFYELERFVLVASKGEDIITKYINNREEMYRELDSFWKQEYDIEICDQILSQRDVWGDYVSLKAAIASANDEKDLKKLKLDIEGLEEYIKDRMKGRQIIWSRED